MDMEKEFADQENFQPPQSYQSNAMVQIEQSRAVQEVQASLIIAKRFPRDINAVYSSIMASCKRISLAKQAMYSYPRGGQMVTGPSIRMAEVLAQNYGNLDFGVRELERRGKVSIAESYCWDMQTNTRQTKVFEVPHEIELKGGRKKYLTDPRDIYELVANNGARRLRACILGIIPGDIVENAVDQCRKTLAKGDGRPLGDRIREMVAIFSELGVTKELIEKRLGHSLDTMSGEELADFASIYTTLRDGQSKRGDFFEFAQENKENKANEIIEAVKAAKKKKEPAPAAIDEPTDEQIKLPEDKNPA